MVMDSTTGAFSFPRNVARCFYRVSPSKAAELARADHLHGKAEEEKGPPVSPFAFDRHPIWSCLTPRTPCTKSRTLLDFRRDLYLAQAQGEMRRCWIEGGPSMNRMGFCYEQAPLRLGLSRCFCGAVRGRPRV